MIAAIIAAWLFVTADLENSGFILHSPLEFCEFSIFSITIYVFLKIELRRIPSIRAQRENSLYLEKCPYVSTLRHNNSEFLVSIAIKVVSTENLYIETLSISNLE